MANYTPRSHGWVFVNDREYSRLSSKILSDKFKNNIIDALDIASGAIVLYAEMSSSGEIRVIGRADASDAISAIGCRLAEEISKQCSKRINDSALKAVRAKKDLISGQIGATEFSLICDSAFDDMREAGDAATLSVSLIDMENISDIANQIALVIEWNHGGFSFKRSTEESKLYRVMRDLIDQEAELVN